jgi:hypothetical protein
MKLHNYTLDDRKAEELAMGNLAYGIGAAGILAGVFPSQPSKEFEVNSIQEILDIDFIKYAVDKPGFLRLAFIERNNKEFLTVMCDATLSGSGVSLSEIAWVEKPDTFSVFGLSATTKPEPVNIYVDL